MTNKSRECYTKQREIIQIYDIMQLMTYDKVLCPLTNG